MEKLPRITKSSRAILRNADAECVVIRDLSFAYQSEPVQPVFKGFSGIFPMYKPVWLRGPNGCGKTTLLRILAGLEQVTDGTIHWHPSVSGDHAFLSHRGETPPVWVFGDEWKEIMKGNGARQLLLETLGVPGFIGRDALSAGQRQRLGIAWVFCSGAKVLLLDEPFSFIAQADREPILQAMLACAKEQKQWFVMASHDGISAESAEYFHFVDVAGIPILK
jgi:ABC-type bacteriocin/lantibiotic exporter with double-glycine peptidase domain